MISKYSYIVKQDNSTALSKHQFCFITGNTYLKMYYDADKN